MPPRTKRGRPPGSTDDEVDQRAWHILIDHITGDSVLAAARKVANLRGVITVATKVSVSAARKAYQRRRNAWGSRVTASRESGIVVTAALDPTYTPPEPPAPCRCETDPLPHLHCAPCDELYPPIIARCPDCSAALSGHP